MLIFFMVVVFGLVKFIWMLLFNRFLSELICLGFFLVIVIMGFSVVIGMDLWIRFLVCVE